MICIGNQNVQAKKVHCHSADVFLRWREAMVRATIRPPLGGILKRSELLKRNYGIINRTMKLKLAGTALKWPQNGTETKVTDRRVTRSIAISRTVTHDCYIPIQTLIFALLRNVSNVHAASKEWAGLPVLKAFLLSRAWRHISKLRTLIKSAATE